MRKTIPVLLTLFSLILLFSASFSTDAAQITDGLPLSQLPLDGREYAYQQTESVPKNEFIIAFDASEEMGILLVTRAYLSTTSEKHLWYLDHNGTVIAVFSFACPGEIGVAWDESDICLFFTRGYVIEVLDCSGNLKERYTLTETNYKTDKAWETRAHRKEKAVASGTYILNAEGMSPLKGVDDYTKLVFVDRATGRRKTIYNAGTIVCLLSWLFFSLAIGFVVLVITKIIRHQKSNVNEHGGNTGDGSLC